MQHQAIPDEALSTLTAAYPASPTTLSHSLVDHPLLTLEALSALAARMRPDTLTHNAALDLPLGITNDQTPTNGLTVHESLARIAECGAWVLLMNIEQDPAYRALMHQVLGEIEPLVQRRTGDMLRLEGFVFISSPQAMTPMHFDPEYNILFQIRGAKTMTLFPAADPDIIQQPFFEQYFNGGPRNLPWRQEWAERGREITVGPGQAIFIPVLAPHWVQNHGEVSISLSLTWRSEWTCHHADACRFNSRLRAIGLRPAAVRRFPEDNRLKSFGYRAIERAGRMLGRNT